MNVKICSYKICNCPLSVRQLCIQKYSTVVTHKILLLRCFMISPCALNKEGTNHSEEQRWRLPVKCNEQWRTFSWASTQVPHLFYASVQLKHDQIFNNGSSVSKISGIDPLLYTKLVFQQPASLSHTHNKGSFEHFWIKAEIFPSHAQ